MKVMLSPLLVSFTLATMLPAQTCREVVRDASGRIVQTIERQKQAGGTERAVTCRDTFGRLTGTSTGSGKYPGMVRFPVPPAIAKQ